MLGNKASKLLSFCFLCFGGDFVEIWDYHVGGESVAENCQILQTRVNRFKSNKEQVDEKELKGYSCDVKFTGMCAALFTSFFCIS